LPSPFPLAHPLPPPAQVLTELVGDKSLERFRLEYEKLHRALKKSHESEKRLIKKCRELNAEIVSNAAKVQTALKLSQEDQNTIASLKREIEKAWKMVDASHEKEARAKETIQQLKTEIQNLSRLVEQGAGLSMGQETAVNELLKARDELTVERDEQTARIVDMRAEIAQIVELMRETDVDKAAAERELHQLRELITTKKAEIEREVRRRERLEKEVKDVRHLTEARSVELRAKGDVLAKLATKLEVLEGQVRGQKGSTEQSLKELEASRARHAKLQQELEERLVQIAALRSENAKQQDELRRRDLEVDQCLQEIQKRAKERDFVVKRNKELDEGKVNLDRERDALRAAISTAERAIAHERSEHDADKRAVADLERERSAIEKTLRRADGATTKQLDLVQLNEAMVAELEAEIEAYRAEALRAKKEFSSLEHEREKGADEVGEMSARALRTEGEVRLREMAIVDLTKKIADADGRLKDQQKRYEAVRSDRNLYSKNLIEAQDEIAEMRRKFKIMNHQIEQLKEEIQSKEGAFVKEHFEHAKVDKERAAFKADLDRIKRAITSSEGAILSHKKEATKLNKIINEADGSRLRQKREYDTIITERDILGTQLIRRNDELALLYEKLRIQQQTLSSGERMFSSRVDDTHLLKLAINNLTREVRGAGGAPRIARAARPHAGFRAGRVCTVR
jgi:chromosome segregation ATPase